MSNIQKQHFKTEHRAVKSEHFQTPVNTNQLFTLKLLLVFLHTLKNIFTSFFVFFPFEWQVVPIYHLTWRHRRYFRWCLLIPFFFRKYMVYCRCLWQMLFVLFVVTYYKWNWKLHESVRIMPGKTTIVVSSLFSKTFAHNLEVWKCMMLFNTFCVLSACV